MSQIHFSIDLLSFLNIFTICFFTLNLLVTRFEIEIPSIFINLLFLLHGIDWILDLKLKFPPFFFNSFVVLA